MENNSYLIPNSIKKSCDDYIKRLQNENIAYTVLRNRINNFLLDESSTGKAMSVLKDRISNYSAILAALILANEYDISDSNELKENVGDEIYEGSVILLGKQEAWDDWVDYGNEASNCRAKERNAKTQDEADSYRGQASNWDGMAEKAKERYYHFYNKEKSYDEINEKCCGYFQKSKELRDAVKNLLEFINSGKDLEKNSDEYTKIRNELMGKYFGEDGDYTETGDPDNSDFSLFWKSPADTDPNAPILEELNSQKAAYQKALEQTNDPHQKDYFMGLIAEIDKNIEEINKRRKELDSLESIPGGKKEFVKTNYTSQKMAALYEEKAAIERAIEMDPSQKPYLMSRLETLEKNIESWVKYGIDNTNHDEEFRFVYDRMEEFGYSEEERLMVVSYWLWVDNNQNLSGKEMPQWWMNEYLTVPADLKVNESNVISIWEGSDTDSNKIKEDLTDYYFKTYYLVDCISGRPYVNYDGAYIEQSTAVDEETKEKTIYFNSESFRNLYYACYPERGNSATKDIDALSEDTYKEDLYKLWFDTMYGGMYDYASGEDSVRAVKYVFDEKFKWADNRTNYGVYNTLTNESTSLYESEYYAYLTKYNHIGDFVEKWNFFTENTDREKQILKYIKADGNYDSFGIPLNQTEKMILNAAYENDFSGNLPIASYKEINIVAREIEDKLCEEVLSDDLEVKVEGNKIIISYKGGEGAYGFGSVDKFNYVIEAKESVNAFGGSYIPQEEFYRCINEFTKMKFDNGLIESDYKDHLEYEADQLLRKTYGEYAVNDLINQYPEEYQRIINEQVRSAYCNDFFTDTFVDVERNRDKAEKIKNDVKTALGVAVLVTSIIFPGSLAFSILMTADGALGTFDGVTRISQGDVVEGTVEVAFSSVEAYTGVKGIKQCAQLYKASKVAPKVKSDIEFRVNDKNFEDLQYIGTKVTSDSEFRIVESSFDNLEYIKTNPLNEGTNSEWVNKEIGLLKEDGTFIDDAYEIKYQKYVDKKIKKNKIPRERLDWKEASEYYSNNSPIARGNKFNETVKTSNKYAYHEVHLENGKRLDSYNPIKGEIVSRKATDLDKISEKTFRKYLSEFNEKYSRGTIIKSQKYTKLYNTELKGQYILEIPAHNEFLPNIDFFKKIAAEYDAILRFTEEIL